MGCCYGICSGASTCSNLCLCTGCTEAAVGGTPTDIAAAQGTLTDLPTEAETGNEVTEIAETGIEADPVTDDFLKCMLLFLMSYRIIRSVLFYSLVHTCTNSHYAQLLVYRCGHFIKHDEYSGVALQLQPVAINQSSDSTCYSPADMVLSNLQSKHVLTGHSEQL